MHIHINAVRYAKYHLYRFIDISLFFCFYFYFYYSRNVNIVQ